MAGPGRADFARLEIDHDGDQRATCCLSEREAKQPATDRAHLRLTEETNLSATVVNLERKARPMLLKTDDVACNAQNINKKTALKGYELR
jgi:hypothetical protein